MQNEKEYCNVNLKYILIICVCVCIAGKDYELRTCDIMTNELNSLYKLIRNDDV